MHCGHQFLSHTRSKRWIQQAFNSYCNGKQTLAELSQQLGKSISTLQRHFDALVIKSIIPVAPKESVNLVIDATFFSRSDGVLVFRAQQRNLHWQFITSETLAEIALGLDQLDNHGYQFKSVVLDGRKGVIQLFEARYPGIPIQLCQFHQAQIIRRYTTNNPKTKCGYALKAIMHHLTETSEEVFKSLFETWCEEYDEFLKERNDQGQFMHRRLRSARRSIRTNMRYLFTYKNYPELKIPNTTNSCDGSFAHWKQKVKIHRGLRKHRRNKVINYLLNQSKKP